MTDKPEVFVFPLPIPKPSTLYVYGTGFTPVRFVQDTELIRLTDHEASRAADKARIAELERDRDEWHRLFDSAGQVAKNACDDRDSHQRVCMRVIQERDELAEAMRYSSATMSAVSKNPMLRDVDHRSLMVEIKRIDAALAHQTKQQ